MGNQWDKEYEQWFMRCVEQDHPEHMYLHYYGYSCIEEYELYNSYIDKEGHPPSEIKDDLEPEDYEPDWEWLNDVARGR
tara:strand:+ start:11348 stop:11584 length:237 start_codon:yes stop_codon:yes gene_type:complete